jgi:hypothetical protein
MGINPKFEDNAKALQALAVILIAHEPGNEGNAETMTQVHALFAKIEAVCELAAQELEEKLQRLSQTLHLAKAPA